MREIKFKAKHKNYNQWIIGDFFWEYREDTRFACISTRDNRKHYVKAETLCQFTGLTDRNGKQIWEGDIIKQTNFDGEEYEATYVVIWSVGSYSKKMIKRNDVEIESNESSFSFDIYHQDLGRCRKEIVIGNIHDK